MKRLGAFACALVFAVGTAACSQSDAGITTKVKAQFAADDLVKAHDINVTTEKHVVTLTGEVPSAAAKEQAVRLARSTEGVSDVVDNLRVNEAEATSGIRPHDNDVDVDVHVGDDVQRGAERTGNAVERGAEKAGDALKRGVDATTDAAKRAGRATRDAVTDNDRDSDKDGK
jgi:hypothetical protein